MSISINHNTRQNGIEISFPSIADYPQTKWLKENGFKYSRNKGLWYKTYSQALFHKASVYFGSAGTTKESAADIWKKENEVINEILEAGLMAFYKRSAYPDSLYIRGAVYAYNEKKKYYEHFPKGRKTPDKYMFTRIFDMIFIDAVAHKVMVPIKSYDDINYLFSQIPSLNKLHSFVNFIGLNPHLEKADDYDFYYQKYYAEKVQHDRDIELWNNWRKKHLKVGQIVFVKNSKTNLFEKWQVETLESYSSYSSPKRVEIRTSVGWVQYMGAYSPENLFLSNPDTDEKAQNLIQAYGNPELKSSLNLMKMKAKALEIELQLLTY